MNTPLYVTVEGPIGVGKTTLVHALAERMGARVVLEQFEENPFLANFYEDKARYAFQTQLFFLMSRFRQQQDLSQPGLFTPNTVADYHLLKDRIFARLTLKDEELALYERVYQSLETHILKPDVVVFLHARQDVLLSRINKRGRAYEANFDTEYLKSLSSMYQHYFAHYTATPLLSLDTSEINYVDSDEPIEWIYERVLRLAGQ